MQLVPIAKSADENKQFIDHPDCRESIYLSMDFYNRVGFCPPWICYYALVDRKLVGSAAFKGKPVDGKVEIAYGTFERFRKMGYGSLICHELVSLSLMTDPLVKVTARTLPDNEPSKKVLRKNGFIYVGMVNDGDDGNVCEWEFINLGAYGM